MDAQCRAADYMSAASEIWRQLKAGTRDESFVHALEGQVSKFKSGVAEITPNTKKLLDGIVKYANGLNL